MATESFAAAPDYWYDGARRVPITFLTTVQEGGFAYAVYQASGAGNEIQTDGTFYLCYPPSWSLQRIQDVELRYGLVASDIGVGMEGVRFYRHVDPIAGVALANRIYEQEQPACASPRWARKVRSRAAVNDPLFPSQWHLSNTGQNVGLPGADINVFPAWAVAQGAGTAIAILDDGLDVAHPDLSANTSSQPHFSFITNQAILAEGAHGTAVAGIAAARGSNQMGGLGVAPFASLLGVQILDELGRLDDLVTARGMLYAEGLADIINDSWGPQDGSLHAFEGPAPIVRRAIENGIASGRNGLGTVFVVAAGNGGASDDSNLDGYANSRYAIAVTASDNLGRAPVYAEAGSNILLNAPSGGGTLDILTTDLQGAALGYNLASSWSDLADRDYTSAFSGTSAAAPMVAGGAALMLSANPALNWREVRQSLAASAVRNDATHGMWQRNGAGYWVNEQYGFGRLDAASAVDLAMNVQPVQAESHTSPVTQVANQPIPDASPAGVSSVISIPEELRIENIEVMVDIPDHTYWGDLTLYLVSPEGTRIRLVKSHYISAAARSLGYRRWVMTTPLFMGERSKGRWTLRVIDEIPGDTGTLVSWSVTIFGTHVPNAFSELPSVCDAQSMMQPGQVVPAAIAQGASRQGGGAQPSVTGSHLEDFWMLFALAPSEAALAVEGISVAFHEGAQGNAWYMRTDNGWVAWDGSMQTLRGFAIGTSQEVLPLHNGRLGAGRYSVVNAYRTADNDIRYCADPVLVQVQ